MAFLAPVVAGFIRRLARSSAGRPSLSLYHRCMSVFLAYVMLISPIGLQSLSQGAIAYAQLDTSTWAESDRTIEYTYDYNGSVTQKTTEETSTTTVLETVTYEYNLANRLKRVETDYMDGTVEIAEYEYNPSGIRVSKHTWSEVDSVPENDDTTVVYLVDSYNHTGYTQVLEETVYDYTDTFVSRTTYTIGDDVIAQNVDGTSEYLLYDGHGSTRQLADSAGAIVTGEEYSYDAYGVMLGGNPQTPADTSLLYAGEHFDTNAQMYYNRARYYDRKSFYSTMDSTSTGIGAGMRLNKSIFVQRLLLNRSRLAIPTTMILIVAAIHGPKGPS